MTARIIDGKGIAQQIVDEVRLGVEELKATRGVQPGLVAILVGDNPASQVYVRMKTRACQEAGIRSSTILIDKDSTTEEVLRQIEQYNRDDQTDGILIQLPLPPYINEGRLLQAVDPQKDVDGFHPVNLGNLLAGRECFVPCTPAGIMEILKREGVPLKGKRAVVLGRSNIVGKPIAILLMHHHATVTICHSRTENLPRVASEGDILVVAVGRPAMVTEEFIKQGAVVIDVGMNRLNDLEEIKKVFGDDPIRLAEYQKKGYTLVGDVHQARVRKVASALTPVPGGVGPMTTAMLLKNTLIAARRRREDD